MGWKWKLIGTKREVSISSPFTQRDSIFSGRAAPIIVWYQRTRKTSLFITSGKQEKRRKEMWENPVNFPRKAALSKHHSQEERAILKPEEVKILRRMKSEGNTNTPRLKSMWTSSSLCSTLLIYHDSTNPSSSPKKSRSFFSISISSKLLLLGILS